MLFAACAADRPEPEGISHGMSGSWSTDPIAFGVSDSTRSDTIAPPPMLTRTPQNEATLDKVQTSGFGVFAARTGAHKYANSSISSNFMFNEKIYYESSSWRYDLTKYWPNGEDGADEYISFFAYAPYSDGSATTGVTDFSLPIELGDPWLVFKLPPDPITNQIDLLYAAKVDQQKTTNGGKVEFAFKHALACVGDKITTAVSEELGTLLKTEVTGNASLTQIEVKLRKITIDYTLTQKGRLALGSKARWQPVMSEAPTITRTVTIDHTAEPQTLATITSEVVSGYEVIDENNGVFYIPIQAGDNEQKATITLDYTITRTFSDASTTNYNGNTTTTIGLQAAGGEVAGEHLNLNLNLSENIRVKPKDFTGFTILPIGEFLYTGSALEPVIVVTNGYQFLVKDEDYTVNYSDNTNVGTATVTIHGKGEYDTDATLSVNFIINPRNINSCTVTGISDLVYTGSAQTVTPVVKYGDTTLTVDVDYTVSGTTSGTAVGGPYSVTITGMGNYIGTLARQWSIVKGAGSISYAVTSIRKMDTDLSTFTNPITHVGDGTISYTSSDPSVATVNSSNGEVTPTGTIGTTTITATVTGFTNYDYSTTSVTYTLKVMNEESIPLTFEAKEAGSVVRFSSLYGNVKYSTNDGETWLDYNSNQEIILSNVGDIVQFMSTSNSTYSNSLNNSQFYVSSGKCYIYGNILSLINYNKTINSNYAFRRLFSGCLEIYNHPDNKLLLPATSLSDNCYESMFSNCKNLTIAPELPATTLKIHCYELMFYNCENLSIAPVLPATTLSAYCYESMFENCKSLNSITCLATDISVAQCTYRWLNNVSATGTLYKAPEMNSWIIGNVLGIPSGWTIQDAPTP